MSNVSSSQSSRTDWDRLRSMSDEDIDVSEIPEITERQMKRAVLRIGGKRVPKDKVFVGMLLDHEVFEYFRKRAGENYRELINETLRAAALGSQGHPMVRGDGSGPVGICRR